VVGLAAAIEAFEGMPSRHLLITAMVVRTISMTEVSV
jgi:hypothetical protein